MTANNKAVKPDDSFYANVLHSNEVDWPGRTRPLDCCNKPQDTFTNNVVMKATYI